jgi:hypothetical protein
MAVLEDKCGGGEEDRAWVQEAATWDFWRSSAEARESKRRHEQRPESECAASGARSEVIGSDNDRT